MAKKPIRFLTIPKLGSMLVTRVDVNSYLNETAFDEMINLITKVTSNSSSKSIANRPKRRKP